VEIEFLYKINQETNFFDGIEKFNERLHLCPKNLLQNKKILSLPIYLTDKKPIDNVLEDKINQFDYAEKKWVLVSKPIEQYIKIQTTKKIIPEVFCKESMLRGCGICECTSGDFLSSNEKELTFKIEDSQINRTNINNLIDGYNYLEALEFKLKDDRSIKLKEFDYIQTRYEEQKKLLELNLITASEIKDSEDDYQKFLIYKQKLRDMPLTWNVENVIWPVIDFKK